MWWERETSAVQYNAMQYNTIQNNTIQYSAVLSSSPVGTSFGCNNYEQRYKTSHIHEIIKMSQARENHNHLYIRLSNYHNYAKPQNRMLSKSEMSCKCKNNGSVFSPGPWVRFLLAILLPVLHPAWFDLRSSINIKHQAADSTVITRTILKIFSWGEVRQVTDNEGEAGRQV